MHAISHITVLSLTVPDIQDKHKYRDYDEALLGMSTPSIYSCRSELSIVVIYFIYY